MITEHDLQAAISECLGVRNPTSSTCIKLAAFYTIKNELFGNYEQPAHSFAAPPENQVGDTITFQSDTEFSQAIRGKDSNEIWTVMDELMETLSVINPRLYASVIRKLQ